MRKRNIIFPGEKKNSSRGKTKYSEEVNANSNAAASQASAEVPVQEEVGEQILDDLAPESLNDEEEAIAQGREAETYVSIGEVVPPEENYQEEAIVETQKYGQLTPLMRAAMQNSAQTVYRLIYNDRVDPNTQNELGYNALMVATSEGSIEAAFTLINAGADCNLQTATGETALIFSIIENRKLIMSALLEAGAMNLPDTQRFVVALFAAAKKDHIALHAMLRLKHTCGAQSNKDTGPLKQDMIDPCSTKPVNFVSQSAENKAVCSSGQPIVVSPCCLPAARNWASYEADDAPRGNMPPSEGMSFKGAVELSNQIIECGNEMEVGI